MSLNDMYRMYKPYDSYSARLVWHETTVGAGAQLLLLALLGTAAELRAAGWLAGLAFTVVTWALLTRAVHRARCTAFGPANRVTLARATLVGGVTALVADSFTGPVPVAVLALLTAVALVLDGVDGKVARRTGTASPLGARFDMEVDAFLILVLSVYVALSLGPWVLLIGGMRYAFAAAARVLPWLRRDLPVSMARKTVAAAQGIALLIAAAGVLPRPGEFAVVGLALAALVWSFGRDIGWLWSTGGRRGAGAGRPCGASGQSAAGRDVPRRDVPGRGVPGQGVGVRGVDALGIPGRTGVEDGRYELASPRPAPVGRP